MFPCVAFPSRTARLRSRISPCPLYAAHRSCSQHLRPAARLCSSVATRRTRNGSPRTSIIFDASHKSTASRRQNLQSCPSRIDDSALLSRQAQSCSRFSSPKLEPTKLRPACVHNRQHLFNNINHRQPCRTRRMRTTSCAGPTRSVEKRMASCPSDHLPGQDQTWPRL